MALLAVLVLAVAVVVWPPSDADAAWYDGLIGPALEWSQKFTDQCDRVADWADMPLAAVGSMTGQIGPQLGLVGGGSVLVGGGGQILSGGGAAAAGGTAAGAGGFAGVTGTGPAAAVAAAPVLGLAVAACGEYFSSSAQNSAAKIGAADSDELVTAGSIPAPAYGGYITGRACPAGSNGNVICWRLTFPNMNAGNSYWPTGQRFAQGVGTPWSQSIGQAAGQPTWAPGFEVVAGNPLGMQNGNAFSGTTESYVDIRFDCGADPTCYQDRDSLLVQFWRVNGTLQTNLHTAFSGVDLFVLATGEAWRGQLRRLVSRTWCQTPGNPTAVQRDQTGPSWWDDQEQPDNWLPDGCNPGEAPVRQEIDRERVGGGITPQRVHTWEIDPAIRSNDQSLACFIVGMTSCPMYDVNPSDPAGNIAVGGPAGVQYPKTGPKVAGALEEWVSIWPAPNPDPNPTTTVVPNPTTTVAPSTTTTTIDVPPTTVPPEDPCRGGASSEVCTPADPPPEDPPGDGDGCFPSGWGWFNPGEWVLKPIKCAMRWLFVPPEPEWSDALDDLGAVIDEPPGQWITGAVDLVEASSVEFGNMRDMTECAGLFGVNLCLADFDTYTLTGWLRTAFFVGLWLALGIAVVRFL